MIFILLIKKQCFEGLKYPNSVKIKLNYALSFVRFKNRSLSNEIRKQSTNVLSAPAQHLLSQVTTNHLSVLLLRLKVSLIFDICLVFSFQCCYLCHHNVIETISADLHNLPGSCDLWIRGGIYYRMHHNFNHAQI